MASEIFIACVGNLVVGQMILRYEALVAYLTAKRSIPSMGPQMNVEVAQHFEILEAVAAVGISFVLSYFEAWVYQTRSELNTEDSRLLHLRELDFVQNLRVVWVYELKIILGNVCDFTKCLFE